MMAAPEATVSQLAAALRYAALGWQVIPLHTPTSSGCSCTKACGRSAGKHPRFTDWVKRATTDEQAIRGWWRTWPSANVGLVTGARSGFFVVDVDPDKNGEVTLSMLAAEHGSLPTTVEAMTGSGGRHLLFRYPGHHVPNSTQRLGPGLDVRGDGGQIVAAPSQHKAGGTYEWQPECAPGERELAAAPSWLLELLRVPIPPAPAVASSADNAVARAVAYIAKMPQAISGSRGHDSLWDVSLALCRGFRLSAAEATSLILSDYNPRCDPPWSTKEVAHKVADAIERASIPFGYLLDAPRTVAAPPPPAREEPGCDDGDEPQQKEKTRLNLQPVSVLLAEAIPDTEWLVSPWLEANSLSAIVAPPNLGKTLLAFWLATQVAAAGGRVAIIEEEGGKRGFQKRVSRAIEAVGGREKCRHIDWTFKPRLSLMSKSDIAAMCAELVGYKLVVIDSLARVLTGVDENDAKEMGQVVSALDLVRERTSAALCSIHHTGKAKWKAGEVPQLADGRGSSALAAGLDTVIALAPVEDNTTGIVQFEIHLTKQRDEDNRVTPRLVRITMTGPAATLEMEQAERKERSFTAAEQRVQSILHVVLNAIPEPPSTPISRNALQDLLGKRRADVQAAVALLIDQRKVKELSKSRLIRIPRPPEREP